MNGITKKSSTKQSKQSQQTKKPKSRNKGSVKSSQTPKKQTKTAPQFVQLGLPSLGRQIKGGQRVHLRWNERETKALIDGIKEFGIGDWKSIRDKYSKVFDVNNRTKMDLSRRWQTLKELNMYTELYDHYSPKSKRRGK